MENLPNNTENIELNSENNNFPTIDNPATNNLNKNTNKKIEKINYKLLTRESAYPIWFSISEAAKIGGVQNKTIRRAIQAKIIKYKILKDRYLIDFSSLIKYFFKTTKLKNKLNKYGIGQYVDKWKE